MVHTYCVLPEKCSQAGTLGPAPFVVLGGSTGTEQRLQNRGSVVCVHRFHSFSLILLVGKLRLSTRESAEIVMVPVCGLSRMVGDVASGPRE